jgi:two-component system, chemotaxis family, protein-glutamate methylesterase/glutaminase
MANDIRVLIVDDSAYARLAIARELKAGDGITVVDFARDGIEAIEKIMSLKPDVVTLDVEMPNMDGLDTLQAIMSKCPTPVVMLSSLTGNGTESTIKALELGAVDFFLKHSLANPVGDSNDVNILFNKIVTASRVKLNGQVELHKPQESSNPAKKAKITDQPASNIVIIGSSTGGPKALYRIVPNLPADLPAAVLIVQHMPPGFTNSLANRLDQLSNITVKEASQGDVLHEGMAYIAKGGYHMIGEKGGVLTLEQSPPVCGVRPSVNMTMQSAAPLYKKSTLGVVLTGMGYDGTLGSQFIKLNRGRVIVEDRSTCVVWGMPKSVEESGYADKVVPLQHIAESIVEELKVKV